MEDIREDTAVIVPVVGGGEAYGRSAYTGLDRAGYTHMVVNHKKNFVDPTTGACTNAVEGYWSRLKRFLRQINTMQSKLLPEHIDEFMRRETYCKDADAFQKIIEGCL